MADPRTGDSPHDLLLALAGRLDDDLLAWCRELVAVGEDARAVELACAALAADRAALPPAVRAALVAAARAARTDLDADTALPPAAGTEVPHRFDAARPVVDELAAAVAGLSDRQVAGCRLHVTARTTPAGAAPGPLPQPVVLAEVAADDARPLDVLAYRLATACERAGVPAAVEVVVAGTALPAYQRTALRTARPVDGDRAEPRSAARPAAPRVDAPHRPEPQPAAAPAPEPAGAPGPDAAPRADVPLPDADPTPVPPAVEAAAVEPDPVPDGPAAAEDAVVEPAAAPAEPEPSAPAGRRAARRTGPRSSLADRMAAWDALDAAPPVAGADTPAPVRARAAGRDDARRRAAADPAADRRPERTEDHPPVEDRRAAPGTVADRTEPEPVADPEETVPLRDDRTTAPDEVAGPPEPVPFGRVDSGPVSFEPASVDPAVDDERPRWPTNGVLPRRRPAAPDPAPADGPDEPPAAVDEQAAPGPVRRPTAVRPLRRAAPEPTGRRARPLAPVEEPPQDAVVRPLRPAPPDAPALASLIDPATGPLAVPVARPEPEPVIDEHDPLGLGRLPLSREESRGTHRSHRTEESGRSAEPPAEPWSDDWITGDWAVRPSSGGEAPTAEADLAPAPADEPGPLLPPETAARLNDEDRELLARLQAELRVGARSRATRRTGVTPDGRPSRPTPPDLAG